MSIAAACVHVLRAARFEAMSIVLNRMTEDIPEEVRKYACHCRMYHLTQLEHMLCLVDTKVMCTTMTDAVGSGRAASGEVACVVTLCSGLILAGARGLRGCSYCSVASAPSGGVCVASWAVSKLAQTPLRSPRPMLAVCPSPLPPISPRPFPITTHIHNSDSMWQYGLWFVMMKQWVQVAAAC